MDQIPVIWAVLMGAHTQIYNQHFIFVLMSSHFSHSSSISSFDSSRSNNGMPYNVAGHVPQAYSNSRPNSFQPDQRIQLFDPVHQQRPHPSLMNHLIQVFFEQYGQDFPFLSYQDVVADYWDGRLPDVIANCVAAMAVKCACSSPRTVLKLTGNHQTFKSLRYVTAWSS